MTEGIHFRRLLATRRKQRVFRQVLLLPFNNEDELRIVKDVTEDIIKSLSSLRRHGRGDPGLGQHLMLTATLCERRIAAMKNLSQHDCKRLDIV